MLPGKGFDVRKFKYVFNCFLNEISMRHCQIPYSDQDEDIYAQIACRDCGNAGQGYSIATRPQEGTDACNDDELEPNDEVGTSRPIPMAAELVVCGGRPDVFHWDKVGNRGAEIRINHRQQRGDIDVLLINVDGRVIATSFGIQDDEAVQIAPSRSDGRYYIYVLLFGAGENAYTLEVDPL